MTEYFIKLPTGNTVHKPNFVNWSKDNMAENVKIALSAFDTDGKEGLSSDELLQAFDYFVNKEKEVAVSGKKGDSLISSKDIEQIVKTDSKFSAIREHLNDDDKVTNLLRHIVMTLSSIVTLDKSEHITKISQHGFSAIKGHSEHFIHNRQNPSVVHAELEEKTINGTKVKVYKSSDGEEYVTTKDGRKYTKEYAAKYLGYETEKTWFGFGEDKYYVKEYKESDFSAYGGRYKQYKIWDGNTNSFKNGKSIYIGEHLRSTGTL